MASEMVKTGYLTKSPPQTNSVSFKHWRRRWFVLLDSGKAFPLAPRQVRLEYYTDETSASHCDKPKGVIDLRDCSGVVSSAKEIRGHKNVFNVVTKRRCYHLSADSINDKEKWVYELQRIVNDCKKPQAQGMATSRWSSTDDDVLAVPKLITPSASGRRVSQRSQSDGSHSTSSGSSAGKGYGVSPPDGSYEEEWDSDEDSSGPASVQSLTNLGSDDIRHKGAQRVPKTFGRDASPRFTGFVAEPLRFGAGDQAGEADDGIPDYKNLQDDTDDGIHDYYEYGQDERRVDETEDGINDYDDPEGREVEDGVQDYANLDSYGQHEKDTDDGIFDYADIHFSVASVYPVQAPTLQSRGSAGSRGNGGGAQAAASPYVNLDGLNLMSTGGSGGTRGGRAQAPGPSVRPKSVAVDHDPFGTWQSRASPSATPYSVPSKRGGAQAGRGGRPPPASHRSSFGSGSKPAPARKPQPAAAPAAAAPQRPLVASRRLTGGNSSPSLIQSSQKPPPAAGRPRPPPTAAKPPTASPRSRPSYLQG